MQERIELDEKMAKHLPALRAKLNVHHPGTRSWILRAGELSEALHRAQSLRGLRTSRFALPARQAWRLFDASFPSGMRRRVCEARKELSGCEVFDGSQFVQRFTTGSPLCGATPLAEIAEFVDRILFTSFRAVHVTAPPCSDRYAAD